jgi:hypothetical protein
MRTPLPLSQQIFLDLVAPPLGTCIWWLMARGWAGFVQAGRVSDRTQRRQRWEFWAIMFAGYVVMFGITIYGLLR